MILEIINSSNNHLTAEQIHLKLKEKSLKMVLATVYNNLAWLNLHGHIRKISVEGYPDRYDKIVKHDHLVCKMCGGLTDITLKDLTEDLNAPITEQILSYDLKISYICPDCRMGKTREIFL